MTSIAPFSYGSHQVRTVLVNGAPEFVVVDVCAVLDHTNPTMAVASLDEDERGLRNVETPSGTQQMVTVTESGLYSLILRSRKPEAKKFKRWITHDVLPAIRKTGGYGVATFDPHNLDHVAQLAATAAEQARQLAAAEQQIQRDAPKVEYVDRFVDPEKDYLLVRTFAAETGWREGDLRAFLERRKIIYRDRYGQWQCYARKPFVDWFYPKPQHEAPRLADGRLRTTLVITARGRLRLADYLDQFGDAAAASA